MNSQPTREYSKRLGTLSAAQFQAALDRFDLGDLLHAEPAPSGLSGQNVFLTSTKGEHVFRGCPHHEAQLPTERFFARLIPERTTLSAPWPYRIDASREIFEWTYAIMPRLPGVQIGHPDVRNTFSVEDQRELARAKGEALAQLHGITWAHAGEYDLASDTIAPIEGGFGAWVVSRVRRTVTKCLQTSEALTDAETAWIERVIADTRGALEVPFEPTFVHHDFKDANLVAERVGNRWRVTGIFDLMTACFGDGEEDLVRSVAASATRDLGLAREFVAAYRAGRELRPGFLERFRIYMLADCLVLWEYGQRNGIWFQPGRTFRDWAGRYVSLTVF